MPKTKGTDVVGLKELFAQEGKGLEDTFLAKLSESDRKAYQDIIATAWTDVEIQSRFYVAAGETLFPGKPDAVIKLHQKLAEKAYSGIYSAFVKTPTPSHLFKLAASIWSSYHDTGIAKIEDSQENSMSFVVEDFPGLTRAMRDAVTGHLYVISAKTGLKNLKVTHDDADPKKWIWHVTWD